MKWNKIEDGLPEDELVLVYVPTCGKPYINTAWHNDEWTLIPTVFADAITHWMALPKPPEE